MRMFVAVVPPDSVVEHLEEFVGPRRGEVPFRWTQPDQWHLTLAFSSEVPDRSYDDLVDRLGRAARKRHPVEARIAGGGAFPNVARAKIIYAGVETDAEELRRMATGARAAVAKSGAAVDGQRFKPHLTLARVNRPVEASRFVRLLDAYDRTHVDGRGARPGRVVPRTGSSQPGPARGGRDVQPRPRW